MAPLGIFWPIPEVAGLEGLDGVVVLTSLFQIHTLREAESPTERLLLPGSSARDIGSIRHK